MTEDYKEVLDTVFPIEEGDEEQCEDILRGLTRVAHRPTADHVAMRAIQLSVEQSPDAALNYYKKRIRDI